MAAESEAAGTAGVAVPNRLRSLAVEAVVKDQVTGAAMALPARSLAPLTVAVYVADGLRAAAGVKVAVRVAGSYPTDPATGLPAASLTATDTVAGWTASVNVADTAALVLTPAAPGAGDVPDTPGAVVSAALGWNRTSTQ